MAVDKKNLTNIDNSQPVVYPNGHTQDNSGSDDGTPLNNDLLSDKFETWDKLMRLYGITFNNLPDNETNGFQFVEALTALASKNDFVLDITEDSGELVIPIKLGFLKDNESIILKATVDKTTETDLKGGLDNVTKTITYIGDFKTGEYVRMINLTSSVILIRMVDADSIIGTKSSDFLATTSNNGLLSSNGFDRVDSIAITGRVNAAGTVTDGSGFTVSKGATGVYTIIHNLGTALLVNLFTVYKGVAPTDNKTVSTINETSSSVTIEIRDTSGGLTDEIFQFLIIKVL